jgi:2-dehydro-3-deoxygluconokinase
MRVVAFGECMIEVAGNLMGPARLGVAGDTYNTAVYLARLGADVRYATALGDDDWSAAMRAVWRAEGIGDDLALICPGKRPGLYAIQTDAAGERHFAYWRDASAAREFFRHPGAASVLAAIESADLFYCSGITLSLFGPDDRARLAVAARAVRDRGGDVAFDPNYRAAGWASPAAAIAAIADFAPAVTIALPSFDDERALGMATTIDAVIDCWRTAGAREIIVKDGIRGSHCASAAGRQHVAAVPVAAIDTTGAGDSFNAGYLHARASGASIAKAAGFGARVAAEIVRHPGAIIDREHFCARFAAEFA